jgi:hypothetical protein
MGITIFAWIGFTLAAYSVIANDAVQTLGTFIVSNHKINWKWLWLGSSTILILTLVYGWVSFSGDISYGRLTEIGFQQAQWYHATAPIILLVLTRYGVPVSTSFLILSSFASTVVLEKMLYKSITGYGVAALSAFVIWVIIARWIDDKSKKKSKSKHDRAWRVAQWCSTGLLWHMWLSHDMANISVYLPRQIPLKYLILIISLFVGLLAYMFKTRGGKIQNIIVEKHNTRYVRSATIVDIVYAIILWYFKYYNDIPMSTTWVFVGLLCGREFGIATMLQDYKVKNVFPLVRRDMVKMMVGLGASVGIVLLIKNGG